MLMKSDINKHLGCRVKVGDLWVWEVSSESIKLHKKYSTILKDFQEIKFVMSQFIDAQIFDVEEVSKNVTLDYRRNY